MKWLFRPWCWVFGHVEHPLRFGDLEMWVDYNDGTRERVESVPGLTCKVIRREYDCPRCGYPVVKETP